MPAVLERRPPPRCEVCRDRTPATLEYIGKYSPVEVRFCCDEHAVQIDPDRTNWSRIDDA